jgi:hypothetical protein
MKFNKQVGFDEDIFERLQQELNASEVINGQMRAYYNVKQCKNIALLKQNLTIIKQIIKDNRKKEKEITREIEKIEREDRKLYEDLTGSYPEEFIKKLKSIENLDYDAALSLAQKFELHRRGIGGVKVIKLWEKLKGGSNVR